MTVRHRRATKLGFDNFVQVGYLRLNHTGYDEKAVVNYRKQAEEQIVPYCKELRVRQAERLGYDEIYYYDESINFLSGNPTPKGDAGWVMEKFFLEDTRKYKFYHNEKFTTFIPYGVTVEEFQHWVYENPTATPRKRKEAWRSIEKKYLPHRDYTGFDLLERGGCWFRQSHIFFNPFYYIDYTLAGVCAMQFRNKAEENRELAWSDYLK